MDSMQASLEAESRAKAEALRIKKKLGSDINELEIALDHSNKANSEAHKSIKRYQGQLRDTEGLLEAETSQKLEITEKAGLAERKANALQGELEESRALLDSADRSKKQTDMELGEARSAVNDMTTINSKLHLRSVILNQPFTPCMLKSMTCCVVQRDLKIRPKKLWSMLPDWLMSSVLSKITVLHKKRRNVL